MQLPNGEWVDPDEVQLVCESYSAHEGSLVCVRLKSNGDPLSFKCKSRDAAIAMRDKIAAAVNDAKSEIKEISGGSHYCESLGRIVGILSSQCEYCRVSSKRPSPKVLRQD